MSTPLSDPSDCIPAPTINLGPYTGVQLLSICTAMALWGLTSVQLFLYFFRSGLRDTWRLKGLVVWLWAMDAVHQCLLIKGAYNVTTSRDIVDISLIQKEYIVSILFTTLVAIPVQCFFAWKIYQLVCKSARIFFAIILVPALVVEFVEGVLLFALGIRQKALTQPTSGEGLALITSSLVVSAIVDVVIAGGLGTILWQMYFVHEGTTVPSASSIAHRTILFAVNAGVWPGVLSIGTLAMVLAWPKNYVYIALYFLLSPLYLNMLLGTLNARTYLRGSGGNLGKVLYLVSKPSRIPTSRGMESTMDYPQFQSRSETETKVHVQVERSTTPSESVSGIQMQDLKQPSAF